MILTQSALCSRGYRIYAITMKNTIIAGLFVCITIPQCALGIYMIVLAARAPGMASISVGICPCLLVLIRWKSSPNTPSYPPHGIPVMRLHQTPEGRTCLYCHLALLRFAFFFARKFPSQLTHITDFSAFLVIIVLAAKSGIKGFRMPGILRTIVQDATIYFLVIFTSHFVLEMTLIVARVSTSIVGAGVILKFLQPNLQLLPAV